MQLLSLSKLNTACSSSLRKVLIGRVKSREQGNLVAPLYFEGQILNHNCNSVRSYSSHRINQFLFKPTAASLSSRVPRNPMAASGSQTVSRDVYVDNLFMGSGSVIDQPKPASVLFGDRTLHSCRKASISLTNQDASFIRLARPGVPQKSLDSRLLLGRCLRHYRASSSASYSDFPAPDVPYGVPASASASYSDGAAADASYDMSASSSASYSDGAAADIPYDISDGDLPLENPTAPSRKQVTQRSLKLHSGVCYLPHPDKLKTGGEDAHFICEEKQAIGVADGVGGWADVGVDAGVYSRLLMSNSMTAILEDSKDAVDPAKILEKAHAETKVMGSSTACIIVLTDKGIHAINLGDSGFIVIRDGSTVFRSPVQQYGFNFPYQLASESGGDLPSSGQVFAFPVASGDVIVAGTDGLFDNLYDNEISALVVQAKRSHLGPEATAQNIAALAQQRAQDRHRQTPFASAAHDAGFRYFGGKLDDITVVVSYITGEENQ